MTRKCLIAALESLTYISYTDKDNARIYSIDLPSPNKDYSSRVVWSDDDTHISILGTTTFNMVNIDISDYESVLSLFVFFNNERLNNE